MQKKCNNIPLNWLLFTFLYAKNIIYLIIMMFFPKKNINFVLVKVKLHLIVMNFPHDYYSG